MRSRGSFGSRDVVFLQLRRVAVGEAVDHAVRVALRERDAEGRLHVTPELAGAGVTAVYRLLEDQVEVLLRRLRGPAALAELTGAARAGGDGEAAGLLRRGLLGEGRLLLRELALGELFLPVPLFLLELLLLLVPLLLLLVPGRVLLLGELRLVRRLEVGVVVAVVLDLLRVPGVQPLVDVRLGSTPTTTSSSSSGRTPARP
ncbi:hypothetical protein ABZ372_50520 [Streptomyces sp. NPDC005921]